jgi:hypothetical protein
VGGATVRVETLDGDPIKLTAMPTQPEDEGKAARPAGDASVKADVTAALLTDKDGKL